MKSIKLFIKFLTEERYLNTVLSIVSQTKELKDLHEWLSRHNEKHYIVDLMITESTKFNEPDCTQIQAWVTLDSKWRDYQISNSLS